MEELKQTEKQGGQLDMPIIELANMTTPGIIKVIGVGGGGGNAVAQMYRDHIPEVRYLVTNTDSKALDTNMVPDHLQLGPGLGAGGRPELGRKYAEESIEKIVAALDKETKMIFLTAGMGGGTGTGASPIIAREARKKGILTVGIVTIPFLFERERQIDKALDGLEELAKQVDAMLVINNQRLMDIYGDMDIISAFRVSDETLSTAVSAITEIISMHGRMNLDFEDVRMVLSDGGVAVMSSGVADGEGRVGKAIKDALHSPLLNNNDIYSADRLLMSITTSSECEDAIGMEELNDINDFMENFSPDIQTKWGLSFDPALGKKVKVTILASGFGLYSPKGKKAMATESLVEKDPIREDRRIRFYGLSGHRANGQHHRPHVYIFSSEDLRNAEVLEMVESVPTKKRTGKYLEGIKNISTQSRRL